MNENTEEFQRKMRELANAVEGIFGKRPTGFQSYLLAKTIINNGPFCATDVIAEYLDGSSKKVILIERLNFPHGYALPGGIQERMTLGENTVKETKEETNLTAKLIDCETRPFRVLSDPEQDPRAFIISVTYRAEGIGKLKAGDDAKKARAFTLEELAELLDKKVWAFPHHPKILAYYLKENIKSLRDEYKDMVLNYMHSHNLDG